MKSKSATILQQQAPEGELVRNFIVISFNADGSELMFNECFDAKLINKYAKENESKCRIFRINLNNKTLQHYEFPDQDKYSYFHGAFSPKGNFVTFVRVPKVDGSLSLEDRYKILSDISQKMEIGIINSDGSNFRILELSEGLKQRPIMSNDETKISYIRGSLRKPGSKTIAAGFDVYEIDLKNKTDKLFAGPYEFFEAGQMQYLKGDDEILMHAYGVINLNANGGLMPSDYTKKYSDSHAYKIKRGASGFIEPIVFEGILHQEDPFITESGAMFFYGQKVKDGLKFFRKDSDKIIEWEPPLHRFGPVTQILPAPNEKKVFFNYAFDSGSSPHRRDVYGIAFFDTATSDWQSLSIPEVGSSKPIKVFNKTEKSSNNFSKKL